MPRFDSEIPNLVNGVSQQADVARFASQMTELKNAFSSPIEGLRKRPPLEFVSNLYAGSVDTDNAWYYFIERDAAERYVVIVRGGATPEIEAFDLDGNSISVLNSSGGALSSGDKAYLATANPKTDLKAITIGDSTFILNRSITAEMDAGVTSTSRDPEALGFIKTGQTDAVYQIILRNTPGGSTTYTGSYVALAGDTQEEIASGIITALDADGANAAYTYSGAGGTIYVKRTNGSDFGITCSSSIVGGAVTLKGETASLSDLPARGYVGFEIKIRGDAEDGQDYGYYVKYEAEESNVTSGFYAGSWGETVKQGIETTFDADTMPQQLMANGIDLRLGPVTWVALQSGDEDSNEHPSFVDTTIKDIFFFKNRLGLLGNNYISFSEDGELFNFYRTSVIDLIDSDRIDFDPTASVPDVVQLRHAISREDDLLLSSDKYQFIVSTESTFSAAAVTSTLVSAVRVSDTVAPIPIDTSLYFAFEKGEFGGLTEYVRQDQFTPFQSIESTQHVPRYIEGVVQELSGSSELNFIVVRTDNDAKVLYTYSYLDESQNRVQSAWSKWMFSGEVRAYAFIASVLYLVIDYGDQTDLLKMEAFDGATDTGLSFKVNIDRRVTQAEVTGLTYDSIEDKTTFTLPYAPMSGTVIQILTEDGVVVNGVSYTGSVVTASGDLSSVNFWTGEQYIKEATLTRPIARQGDPKRRIPNAKFYTTNGVLEYDDTAAFTVQVASTSKPTYTYEFTTAEATSSDSSIGGALLRQDGEFVVPVYDDPQYVVVTLLNDTPLPSNFLSITWEGYIRKRI